MSDELVRRRSDGQAGVKPLALGRLVAICLGGALVAGSSLALLFGEWLAPGAGHLWDLPSHQLYDVIRASIGSLGLIGAGGAAAIAYRRQKTAENQHRLEVGRDQFAAQVDERAVTAAFHTRFNNAAEQLGHADAAIRVAGVYSMAQLADDWGEQDQAQRQVCVDVLCAYLRMPERQLPDQDEVDPRDTRVRETICAAIRTRLTASPPRWTGIVYDLRGATFTAGRYSLADSRFVDGYIDLDGAAIHGAALRFSRATFERCTVGLPRMRMDAGELDFSGATFIGDTEAERHHSPAVRRPGDVRLHSGVFDGGTVTFAGAGFENNTTMISRSDLAGATVDVTHARIACNFFQFQDNKITGGSIDFADAQLAEATAVTIDLVRSPRVRADFGPFTGGSVPPVPPQTKPSPQRA